MKTPIEKMIDEMYGFLYDHLENNKPAKDAMMGAITIASHYLDAEKNEIMSAWKAGFNYGNAGGNVMSAKSFYLQRYKPE